MKSFIQKIIEEIPADNLESLRQCCYVFPTRRGALMFDKLLAKRFPDETFWAPSIMSIENFVEFMTRRKVTDNLTLLFELYDVYLQLEDVEQNPFDTFDKFMPWGEILLKDFDEIDKYLVDAKDLYENIYDIREVEAVIGVDEEVGKAVEQFRSVVSVEEKTDLLKNFLRIWEIVGDVYTAFKQQLKEKKLAYEGMLYREILEKIKSGKHPLSKTQIYFCGFNALSNAEEVIYDHLLKKEMAWVYWDADVLYLNNKWFEAGMFVRYYKEKWTTERSKWFIGNMMQTPKNINIVGTVQQMAQVKVASGLLKKTLDETESDIAQTAVVLADENLLLPMLYALPNNVPEANVTMGYPLKNTPLATLVNSLFDLHINVSGKNKIYFKTADVTAFFNNSYVQSILKEKGVVFSKWMLQHRRNYVFIEDILERLEDFPILKKVFVKNEKPSEFLTLLRNFLKDLFIFFVPTEEESLIPLQMQSILTDEFGNIIEMENDMTFTIEQDFIYQFLFHLRVFVENIKSNFGRLSLTLIKKMFISILPNISASFSGKTNKGLQMMGFLETRTLDFENLFILSVNEGKLPTKRKLNSYIPYSLRKAFKMPTFEEQDAIYAYHFYRLLQTAKNVTLIYDLETDTKGAGERSRFIPQLLNSVKYTRNPNITIKEKTYSTLPPQSKQVREPINVSKTDTVLERLQERIYTKGNRPQTYKYFSPTALSTYINCPLEFYFKYVASLKETVDESTTIEATDLGNIVHQTLESLYKPLKNKVLQKEDITQLNDDTKIVGFMNDALKQAHLIHEDHNELEGKNVLTFQTIRQLIEDVLITDSKTKRLKLHELETTSQVFDLNFDGENCVGLSGTIDRVDEVENLEGRTIRIVDYKTGNVKDKNLKLPKNLEEYMDQVFGESEYRYTFQAFYYTFLYWKAHPNLPLQAGIYSLKETYKGVQLIPGDAEKMTFSIGQLLTAFEEKLKGLFQELLDTNMDFQQTENEDNCKYCVYREICGVDF